MKTSLIILSIFTFLSFANFTTQALPDLYCEAALSSDFFYVEFLNTNQVMDDDFDGVLNADEDVNGNGDITDDDTDFDGTPNYLDNDDDGDGVPTSIELFEGDTDQNGTPNYLDDDDDGDDIPTAEETLEGDTDMDFTPNYLDDDDDGDGVDTAIEYNGDTDMDGDLDYLDNDDDGDGILTILELGLGDTDMDGEWNYLDDDDDGDGVPTAADCNHLNPTVYLGAPELCDGIDNNCNNQIDENCGCTDPSACNYDVTATTDDLSCFGISGCITGTACNFDPTATCDNGSCIIPDGCTDPIACNYDPAANCDDGSCELPGCTNPASFNYNPNALCEDGSCSIPTISSISILGTCYGGESLTIQGTNFTSEVRVYIGGKPAPNLISLSETQIECTIPAPSNFGLAEILLVTSNGVTDSSPEFENRVVACTDPSACNYNPNAFCEDGSCIYDMSSSCPADFNDDGEIGAADLLSFLGVFGESCIPN